MENNNEHRSLIMHDPSNIAASRDLFSDPNSFAHGQRVAKLFAASKLVPNHFRGNVADCLIALQIARRLDEDPLTVFQNIYFVNGKPGWATSYLIARANRSGVFQRQITWHSTEEGNDGLSVTAKATLSSGDVVTATATMRMAMEEGWTKNSKYQSMPEHMLRWRSATMLIRLFAPEIMTGLPAMDEIEAGPPELVEPATDRIDNKTCSAALDRFAEEVVATPEEQAPDGDDRPSSSDPGDDSDILPSRSPEAAGSPGPAVKEAVGGHAMVPPAASGGVPPEVASRPGLPPQPPASPAPKRSPDFSSWPD
jgi:hypothetical protein